MRQHHPRGMYDQIEGMLTSITMQLRSAIKADADLPARRGGPAGPAADPFQRAKGWARTLSVELGSVLLDTLGLAATIEWHLHQIQKCTGIRYELTVNNASGCDVPEAYAANLFGIYSETMSNIARRASASRVVMTLTITPTDVSLVMSNDGSAQDDGTNVSVSMRIAASP